MTIDADDLDALKEAANTLENPGLVARVTDHVGKPIEQLISKLPDSVSERIGDATTAALQASFRVAISTLNGERSPIPSNTMHKVLATLSGAVGGAFGLPALAIELPVSTTIMLRSIADIAREAGEDIGEIETQLECFKVFAFGSRSEVDDGAETAYYPTRAALALAVSDAAAFLAKSVAKKGIAEEGAPVIVRLIAKVAARFSVPVSQKFAAQSVPVIGAAGGATINLLFINHFQDMARAHFTVRRLERKYGDEVIQKEYERFSCRDKEE